ncbi:MAG: hypothetical protein WBB45_05140 [Cyclobacteriaceae bacterium]
MSIFKSIWKGVETSFSVIAGDGDALYPDNDKRKRRASELYDDVKLYQEETASLKDHIEEKLISIGKEYNGDFKIAKFDFTSWHVESVDKLNNVLGLSNMQDALMLSGLFALSDKDKQTRLIDTIDLPLDMKMITIKGVPVLPIGGLIGGSIAGAASRNKLREYINNICPVRVDVFYYKLLLEALNEELSKLGSKEFLVSIYGKEVIEEKFDQKTEEIEKAIHKIKREDAVKELSHLDNKRESWTNEDGC